MTELNTTPLTPVVLKYNLIKDTFVTDEKTMSDPLKNDSYISPELLSPAGDAACLDAAISAGCDAVYAGCDRYGARAYAGNFTSEEFLRAIDRVHLFRKKIYLTLNTLIKPDEFDCIHDLVEPFYREGLDGIIVQDLGVVSLIRDEFTDLPIHASTQMSVSSSFGAALLKEAGIKRIVPSRELSLDELGKMREDTGMELECFIHGAMCYSYSGMCLMSGFLGGRSGNRGRCAGPCRQPYSLGKIRDSYLLSMKDLCVIDILPELISAGISSFKIEGRMKNPAYVYGVTGIYRTYIDRILEDPSAAFAPSEEDRIKLASIYARGGISEGYYNKHNGLSLITMEKGSYKRDDGEIPVIPKKRYPLKAEFSAFVSCEAALTLTSAEEESLSVTCFGDIVQEAKTHPMDSDDMAGHLDKTGDSDFYFEDIDVHTDGCSFLRVASLNGLRRNGLEMMKERITGGYKRCL